MKLLIDTQVFVWLINDNQALGTKVKRLLTEPTNQVALSYFSLFEIVIKTSIGKMAYDPSVIDDLPAMDINFLLPTTKHLTNYQIYDQTNKDPFDNMLLTVAETEKQVFLTADKKILQTRGYTHKLIDATK